MLVVEFIKVAEVGFVHVADPNNRSLQTSRFRYMLIQIKTPGPSNLCSLQPARPSTCCACGSFISNLCKTICHIVPSWPKSAFTTIGKSCSWCSIQTERMLIRLGAVQARAVKVGIVTCSVAYHPLQACGIPARSLDAIQVISTNPAGLMVLPLPQHVM